MSKSRLRDLRDKQGARTLYGHDPAQWQALPARRRRWPDAPG